MEMSEQLSGGVERLAAAAEALERTVARLGAEYMALEAKVDRIVAMIEERLPQAPSEELAASAQVGRKTVSATVATLLAKGGVDGGALDEQTADRMLHTLTVEQRIAVKAEMARAGLLS